MKKSVTIDFEYDWGSRIKSDYAINFTTDKILQIYDQNMAKGTFFISTEILPKNKNFILKIIKNGHEIASHGNRHSLNYDTFTKKELKKEIEDSKKILEDITGKNVLGFRTPAFKRNRYTDEILEELNFRYDSSTVLTSLKGRYKPLQYANSKKLKYFSISTIHHKLPAGIKWINIFGYNITSKPPHIIYAHPFDFLSIKETIKLYDKNKIPLHVLLFYLFRIGNIYKTLNKVVKNSKKISDFLEQK